MHPAFARVDHRPWPLPTRPWRWRQDWCDLLFAHWPVPVAAARRLVPPGLEVDTFDGATWIGVVPFRMEAIALRPLPALPWTSAFPELNLRLYVTRDGKPGVWFLSLDATNPLAVWTARRFFHLPYVRARISVEARGEGIRYRCDRRGVHPPVAFEADYSPAGEPYEAAPGTLERWLTERYALYARSPEGTLYRGDIHHAPWPLRRAEAAIRVDDLPTPHGLALDGPPHLLHFVRRLEVVLWPLVRVG